MYFVNLRSNSRSFSKEIERSKVVIGFEGFGAQILNFPDLRAHDYKAISLISFDI